MLKLLTKQHQFTVINRNHVISIKLYINQKKYLGLNETNTLQKGVLVQFKIKTQVMVTN